MLKILKMAKVPSVVGIGRQLASVCWMNLDDFNLSIFALILALSNSS